MCPGSRDLLIRPWSQHYTRNDGLMQKKTRKQGFKLRSMNEHRLLSLCLRIENVSNDSVLEDKIETILVALLLVPSLLFKLF